MQRTNVGVITTLADGVARVSGLSKVMFNEMIEFPNNVLGIGAQFGRGIRRMRTLG